MTTFPCYASTFYVDQSLAVVDVTTILTKLSAILPAESPAWTESPAGTFKSPVDAAGRFMKVIVSRVSATRMQWKVVDQNGVTICDRTIDIDVAGDTVNYYHGQFHCVVVTERATPEPAHAWILDETPYAQNAVANYVCGNAFRTSAGSADGTGSGVGQLFAVDNGAAAQVVRYRGWLMRLDQTVITLVDGTGAEQFFPVDICINLAGTFRFYGRQYQSYMCESGIAFGTTKQVPIDTTGLVLGTFKVLPLATLNGARVMVRTA